MNVTPFDRPTALDALRDRSFDLVVVGGGITGAGVALDAASRGLRTALVERDDFASGTSSKSSKLVHGGLRYLQQGEVALVYEALAERRRLLRNAPHLVRLLPFLIPMLTKGGVMPAKLARTVGGAMWAYDLTGGIRVGKVHKRLKKHEALAEMPTLPADRVAAAYLYYDAAADDARLVLAVLRTAALEHGAVVANRVGAVGLTKDDAGAITGLRVRPADGEEFTIATRAVVNAAGVWADDILGMDTDASHTPTIRPAKGIHITVPWSKVRNRIAAVVPVPGDKRSVFVVPNGEFTYIGTTDTDYDGPVDDPQCTAEDVEYLLRAINGATTNEITTEDVVGTWAGLRPLVMDASSSRTADLSRGHKVTRSASGLVSITGGKLTTYRHMAADTVDEVVRDVLGADAPASAKRSRTGKLKLRGAEGYESLPAAAAVYPSVSAELIDHLGGRYGGEARVLMGMIEADPSLAEPLVPGLPYVRAEALFAARFEMATCVDDVLSRRTRARILGRDDSAAAAQAVAEILAPELGWDEDRIRTEVAEYRASIDHERASASLPEVLLEQALVR